MEFTCVPDPFVDKTLYPDIMGYPDSRTSAKPDFGPKVRARNPTRNELGVGLFKLDPDPGSQGGARRFPPPLRLEINGLGVDRVAKSPK
ncbi:hypothetical protein N7457_006030 [Penicillium paradoxum]|uniref:uncharacterized protein n=1 Tax=Penicillium paradoxum TaxID=176176 RepID=UPI0025485161|nr:uncharacterized protein N7457_006030 [Penicillium paradoxum]KAJ5780870.1 hypothetical protein N7457_006030 [Penicillium paradoxum]